jgi:cytosine/adenosine deaminase-related metal-dependent hydrolase
MEQIIRARHLVRRWASETPILDDAALYVSNGEIREIGDYAELARRHSNCRTIGDGSHLVMPGFVNAHSHGRGITTLKLGILDEPLELRSISLRVGLTSDPYWDTLYGCARQLEGGVTSTLHHDSNYNGSIEASEPVVRQTLAAYADSGIRYSFALGARDQHTYGVSLVDDVSFVRGLPPGVREEAEGWASQAMDLDDLVLLYDRIAAAFGGETLQFGPINLDSCSEGMLRRLRAEATARGAKIQLHLLETQYQKAYALKTYGRSGVEWLTGWGFLAPDVSCAHCVWFTERDIDAFKASGAIVVHNPGSNLRLRSGLAPISSMARANLPIAFGIDSLALNDDEDMLQELRVAQLLQSPPGVEHAHTAPIQLLHWATETGANAIGGRCAGRLEPNCPADIVMIDLSRVERDFGRAGGELADKVLYWVRKADIDKVIVGGELLVDGGRYIHRDRDEIEAEAYRRLKVPNGSSAVDVVKREIAKICGRVGKPSEPYYRLNSRS